MYLQQGYRHRVGDLPALIDFDAETGKITREEYYQNDVLHREGGPAVVEYGPTGAVKAESQRYFFKGQAAKKLPTLDP